MQRPAPLTITDYHNRTKHDFGRMARSAGYLDWANQPLPFRYYRGTEQTELPLLESDPQISFAHLLAGKTYKRSRLDLGSLAGLLELSLGLSAWKSAPGAGKWALRINPSSGNLHPTEAHLIVPPIPDLQSGVYHYDPYHHCLERRAGLTGQMARELESCFGGPGFMIVLTSIYWRESWKYGERAYRYCLLDIGHALAALSLAAGLLGWRLSYLSGITDDELVKILGFDQVRWPASEKEVPQLAVWISCSGRKPARSGFRPGWLSGIEHLDFAGLPSRLSRDHVAWQVIEAASLASEKRHAAAPDCRWWYRQGRTLFSSWPDASAAGVIRRRRSAAEYDASRAIDCKAFIALLDAALPCKVAPPFNSGVGAGHVGLMIFVHRVADMEPGLYCLVPDPELGHRLGQAATSAFQWRRVDDLVPLYLLAEGDFAWQAAELSCRQPIAGDSAFSLAMVAHFGPLVVADPFYYRLLHWQCGMIGQMLYLAAEAWNLRGTGIGCFFDDPVHRILGLRDDTFQSLYHFTAGHPLEDRRLETLPPYHHLERKTRV